MSVPNHLLSIVDPDQVIKIEQVSSYRQKGDTTPIVWQCRVLLADGTVKTTSFSEEQLCYVDARTGGLYRGGPR